MHGPKRMKTGMQKTARFFSDNERTVSVLSSFYLTMAENTTANGD